MNIFRALVRVLLGSPARREPSVQRPPPEPLAQREAASPDQDSFEAAPGGSGVTQRSYAASRPTWAESRGDGFDGVRRRPLDLSGGVKVPVLALEVMAKAPVEPSNGFVASLDDLPVALDPLDSALIGAALQVQGLSASAELQPLVVVAESIVAGSEVGAPPVGAHSVLGAVVGAPPGDIAAPSSHVGVAAQAEIAAPPGEAAAQPSRVGVAGQAEVAAQAPQSVVAPPGAAPLPSQAAAQAPQPVLAAPGDVAALPSQVVAPQSVVAAPPGAAALPSQVAAQPPQPAVAAPPGDVAAQPSLTGVAAPAEVTAPAPAPSGDIAARPPHVATRAASAEEVAGRPPNGGVAAPAGAATPEPVKSS